MHPNIVHSSHPNLSLHLVQSPKIGSKKVPWKHLLLIDCPFLVCTLPFRLDDAISVFRTYSAFWLFVTPRVVFFKIRMSPLLSMIELRRPPVTSIWLVVYA